MSREDRDQYSLMSHSDIHIGAEYTNNQIKVNFDGDEDLEWEIHNLTRLDQHYLYTRSVEKSDLIQYLKKHASNISKNYYIHYYSNRKVLHPRSILSGKLEEIVDFQDFSKWFKETEDLENEQRLSDNINYRHPVLAAVRDATYSLLGKDYCNLTFKRSRDRMTIKKSDREISINLLSDGEQSLLAMVGHLARTLAEGRNNGGNPLEASALILIDEIELHLHPAWQRMIIPRLTQTFPNCQFIVTTHSPQVLSHVDPECIHILDYDDDNVVVKRPDSSYGLDSNRILEDILGVSKRPQEIQERMSELFRTINNNDLEGAKEIVKELGDRIGIDEPELVKAEATIKRREIIGR